MSSRHNLCEIMEDEEEEAEENVKVINICPKAMDSSDDLSVMQQYYSASPPSKSVFQTKNPDHLTRPISKGANGSNGSRNFGKNISIPNDNSKRSTNGPMPFMTTMQSLAAHVNRSMSSAQKQLPPESVFNITNTKSGPVTMEISSQGIPIPSGTKPVESLHRTDKNDNLIPTDNRRVPPGGRMDHQYRMPGAHLGMTHGMPHPPRHFLERPDLPPPYGRPYYPSYGFPYYGVPYFPPPAPPPMSAVSHGAPPPSRMPGMVCRVTPPPDASPNSPVFGVIQREKDESGQVKTFLLCDFCQLKCQDQEAFLNHVLTHMFVCSLCGQQTFSRIQLISHIAKRHPSHYAKLGHFETMQVARLGLRPTSQLNETDSEEKEESQNVPTKTSNKPTPSEESTPFEASPPKGPSIQGITVQEDGYTICDLCKVTTENSDLVLWSAHVYLHQVESAMRIHCTLCGKFTSGPEEMLDHFFATHSEKRVGVAFAVQAVSNNKLVYVWFCPHCSHSNESVANLTEHLQAKHNQANSLTYPCIKTALEVDIKESLLERTAGVHTSLDLQVPCLLNWTATDGSAEPDPESFIHSTPMMMQRTPESHMEKPLEPNPNNLAALKSMYDNMIVRTRMVADLIIAAKDYYKKTNGVYSCKRCLYRTRQKHLVAEHLWHHLPGSKWACNYCMFTNKRRRNVVDHLKNKHKALPPKLIVQVPTVIDFDNKPMNVQQLNVARKSTSSALNRHIPNCSNHADVVNMARANAERLETSSVSVSAQKSDNSPNKSPDGVTLRSVLEASKSKETVLQSSPKKNSPKESHSNSVTPVLSPSSSQSSLLEMSRMGKFPMTDDSSSCWVCNVCHRKDERWSVMRNHLMFAHPDLYSNECLALSRVKKPLLGLQSLTLEALGKRRLLHPCLLSVEKIFMYPHLLSNGDLKKAAQKQEIEKAVEEINDDLDDTITLDCTGDSDEVLLLEVSDESGDEQKPKEMSNQRLNNAPKKRAFAKKSTASSARTNMRANKRQSAKKLTAKRVTSGVNSSVENGSAIYGCFYCSREFPDSVSAREHLLSFHRDKQPLVINLQQIHNPNVSRIFLCTSFKCSYSTFNETKFKFHVMKHSSGGHLEDGSILLE